MAYAVFASCLNEIFFSIAENAVSDGEHMSAIRCG
jgi:hypothetical protein